MLQRLFNKCWTVFHALLNVEKGHLTHWTLFSERKKKQALFLSTSCNLLRPQSIVLKCGMCFLLNSTSCKILQHVEQQMLNDVETCIMRLKCGIVKEHWAKTMSNMTTTRNRRYSCSFLGPVPFSEQTVYYSVHSAIGSRMNGIVFHLFWKERALSLAVAVR